MNPDGDVDWSSLRAPRPGLRCSIVLPARNESLLLPRALHAIVAQRDVAFSYEVIVLANNCSDDTAARARELAERCTNCPIHVVEVEWPSPIANVGRARRALMEAAAQRVADVGGQPGLIVSTDADTCVAVDWLAATSAAIDAGAEAVGGRIVPMVDATLPSAVCQVMRLDDLYRTWRERLQCLVDPDPADPWPRHYQHFGASLAVTVRTYRAVGGLPLVPFLEDEALVRELRRDDKAIRHSPHVRVLTSARLDGRVEVGLSWQLREWSKHPAEGTGPRVVDPVIEARFWNLRHRTRALWRDANSRPSHKRMTLEGVDQVAEAMQLDRLWLAEHLGSARSFGRLWDEMEQSAGGSMAEQPLVPMEEALHALRRLVRAQRLRAVS